MGTKIKAAAAIVGAAASTGLAGTAFAYGKPGVHVNKNTKNYQCDRPDACGNLSQDLNGSGNGDLDKNKVNVLSGDLNKDNVLSRDNVNAPVTVEPDICGSPIELLVGEQRAVCVGNFHAINAGQEVRR